MTYLKIDSVSKSYGVQEALKPVSFSLQKGEFLSIVGESGSGKSTLLRIMAGLEVQDQGRVFLGEKEILSPKHKIVAGYPEVKLIHQDFHLFPNSTVAENIARPLLQFDKTYAKERVEKLIQMLGLEQYKDRLPRELSGGQQQKVAIAKALSVEPEVLLLDEPFSSLDSIQKHRLIAELKSSFTQMGTTVIFVTHDLDDALRLTDNLMILQAGKVVQQGDSRTLCQQPKSKYVARLFSPVNLISKEAKTYIRPNEVKLRTKGGLLAHVEDSRFLVHFNSLQIRLKDSGQLWEVDDPQRKYKIGERVYLSWDPEKVLTLK